MVFWVGYLWVYVFMFKRVCICCFWAVGKRGKKSETWSGKERKYGLWVREKRKKKKKMEWGREQIWAVGKAKQSEIWSGEDKNMLCKEKKFIVSFFFFLVFVE